MDQVSLHDVSVVRQGKGLLRNVSWAVKNGEHWAVLGRNGSGKTLTLRIVSGYLWPTTGTVEVLEKKFGSFDLRELRKEIGWVSLDIQYEFQRGYSAEEVVLSGPFGSVGLRTEAPTELQRGRAKKLFEVLEIAGLETRQFHTLSFGEQKRVLIGRALLGEPKLLVLDEPCTGLDFKSREEFLGSLQTLATQHDSPTLLFVTHHVEEIMPFMTHALLLKKGEIVASGEKSEVLTSKHLSEALDLQIAVQEANGRYWTSVA